jgi:hypothetical protein
MARIRCHYLDCAFLDEAYCSAAQIELDPDTGCATYSPNAEAAANEDWEDTNEDEEWEEIDGDEEDEDEMWTDEDDGDEY